MNEGTIFSVVAFNDSWPPPFPAPLLRQSVDDGSIRVVCLPDGRIGVQITDRSGGYVADFLSQPLKLFPKHRYIIGLSWQGTNVELRINGHNVQAAQPGDYAQEVQGGSPVVDSEMSIGHPDAIARCAGSVGTRQMFFAWYNAKKKPPQNVREIRRRKTLAEQTDELRRSMSLLQEGIQRAGIGEFTLIGAVAGELRSLLYFSPGKRNYNPLLLRLADRSSLPLPVFAVRDGGPLPITDGLVQHYKGDLLSIRKTVPTQELIDLQEYLSRTVHEDIARDLSTTSAQEQRQLSGFDVILEAASTLGLSHYDDDVPEALDKMRSIQAWNRDLLTTFLLSVAQVTIPLSQNVIDSIKTTSP